MSTADQIPGGTHRSSGRRQLRSNSLAKLGLGCAIRRSVRLALARNLWKIVALVTVALAAIYARTAISSRRSNEEMAGRLASTALERLSAQAARHQRDPGRVTEAWISMAQLRDDILRSEFSARRRQQVWDRVQAKVEGNSNVRPMVRQGKTGEVSRVWEWIGAVGAIEAGGTKDGERPGSLARTNSMGKARTGVEGGSKISRTMPRRWEDSRPIF